MRYLSLLLLLCLQTQAWAQQPKKLGCSQGDCENGKGLYYYENGDKYGGEFKEGKPNGRGVYYFKNGNTYRGNYKDGKREGYGTFTWANGDIYIGEYKNDQREGEGTYYYAKNARPAQEGTWKNGVLVAPKQATKPEDKPSTAVTDLSTAPDPFANNQKQDAGYHGARFKALSGLVEGQARTALVIGNSRYTKNPLKNPENDALSMAQELQRSGFEVIIHTNTSQEELKKAIRSFGQELKEKGGVGMFYYAGHGLQADGRNYLVPVSADIRKEQDIEFECVDLGRILVEMEYADNLMNIVILDACRDNPYREDFKNGSGKNSHNGLAAIGSAPYNSFIAFSTAPGSVAQDGEGENGLYSSQLLTVMREKNIKLEDIFKRVRSNVRRMSNGQQIPWELSSVEQDFYFKKD
jgi:hypothetical protein